MRKRMIGKTPNLDRIITSEPKQAVSEVAALWLFVEGTASETGTEFFRALVENLAAVMGTTGAWVTEYLPQARRKQLGLPSRGITQPRQQNWIW